jgi:N-acetylmuramoyl-L-alanine amidase
MLMKVVLDAGHGGKFSGAVALTPEGIRSGLIDSDPRVWTTKQWRDLVGKPGSAITPPFIKEKHVNLIFTRLLGEELRRLGVEVIYTRMTDTHLAEDRSEDLTTRAMLANAVGGDCFISIHCNGYDNPQANGYEVFTSPGLTQSDFLAEEILHEMGRVLHEMRARVDLSDFDSDKEAGFVVLRQTRMPAVLIELGFLTNSKDVIILLGKDTLSTLAHRVAIATFHWWMEKLNLV